MKSLFLVLTILLTSLQFKLWTGEGSVTDVFQMRQAVAAQRTENVDLRARNNSLAAEVKDLKTGDAAIEERARSELGMIGKDETFFQVVGVKASSLKKTAYKCDDKNKCILPGFGQ